jgi:uncharacterized protein YfaS (alpha-2-macroglobulin family)
VSGKPGEYLLEVLGKDAGGRDVLTSMMFDVTGDDVETDWNYRNPDQIDLVADKDSYAPGETATLLVKTPISGEALVSVERDRVLRSFVVPLSGNAPSVQVLLTEPMGRTCMSLCCCPRREGKPAEGESAGVSRRLREPARRAAEG